MSAETKVTVANFLERFINQEIITEPKSPIRAKNAIKITCAEKNPPNSRRPKILATNIVGLKLSDAFPRKKGIAMTEKKATNPKITNVISPNKIAYIKLPLSFSTVFEKLDQSLFLEICT